MAVIELAASAVLLFQNLYFRLPIGELSSVGTVSDQASGEKDGNYCD